MSKQWVQTTIDVNGIQVFYTRTGGQKPPFIMNHGATDNGLCWVPVAEQLQDRFDVILPDARGHGRSSSGDGEYGVAQRAEDLIALIKALRLEKPIIMGHSMGAQTALFTGSMYPENIRAVILEDPLLVTEDEAVFSGMQNADVGKMMAENARKSKRLPRFLLRSFARKNFNWPSNELRHWANAKKQLSDDFIDALEVMGAEPDPWDALAGIIAPVLLITGAKDKQAIVSEQGAEQARQLHSRLEVVRLNTGHNIRREDFDGYMAAVNEFLGKV